MATPFVPSDPAHVLADVHRYDPERTAATSVAGDGYRLESASWRIGNRSRFEHCLPAHALFLIGDGHPGGIEVQADGGSRTRVTARAGQLWLIPANRRVVGQATAEGRVDYTMLLLSPDHLRQATGGEIDSDRLDFVLDLDLRNTTVAHAMLALAREVEQPGLMTPLYVRSLALVILTELVRHHSTVVPRPVPPHVRTSRVLRRVTDFIETNLGDRLSLETLAAQAGLSPAQLERRFKRTIGRSVHQYVLRRRAERAAALLAATDRSISGIAVAVGLSGQAHLTSLFRRVYGTTPGAYRRERSRRSA